MVVHTIGFVGLGIMGGPMAANLVRAGFDVVGHNRSRGKVDRLVEAGGRGASSAAEAARDRDVFISMLPDSPDVEEFALGDGGALALARPGSLYIDMSTVRPATAVALAEAGRARGVGVLDAPVSGGERGAIEGTLSIMVGGDPEHVATARPVLEALGSTVVHVGTAGAGQTVKAANQLLTAVTIEAVAEAVVFLEAHGVDPTVAISALAGGLAGSAVLDRRAPSMVQRDFTPGFRCALHHKDLGILTSAARDAGVTIPLGAIAAQLMGALVAQGHGDLDNTALLRLVEELSGRRGTDLQGWALARLRPSEERDGARHDAQRGVDGGDRAGHRRSYPRAVGAVRRDLLQAGPDRPPVRQREQVSVEADGERQHGQRRGLGRGG